MAEPRPAEPARLIVGMLSAQADALDAAEAELARRFGPLDLRSDTWPHDYTHYYAAEMGEPLLRRFVAARDLLDPADLAEAKLATNAIERDLAARRRWPALRPVNLDPGYVTPAKLVLASCKDFAHRICLGRGVYAEVTLRYVRGGAWQGLDWTYPDYRSPEYHEFLDRVRAALVAALKESRPS